MNSLKVLFVLAVLVLYAVDARPRGRGGRGPGRQERPRPRDSSEESTRSSLEGDESRSRERPERPEACRLVDLTSGEPVDEETCDDDAACDVDFTLMSTDGQDTPLYTVSFCRQSLEDDFSEALARLGNCEGETCTDTFSVSLTDGPAEVSFHQPDGEFNLDSFECHGRRGGRGGRRGGRGGRRGGRGGRRDDDSDEEDDDDDEITADPILP